MWAMSAILSADDLNDFISPGVACIKPVETLPLLPKQPDNPYEVTTEDRVPADPPPPAQISLTDCLACSGCVTSAEAVLVSLQSHAEVLRALDSGPGLDVEGILRGDGDTQGRILVASVSPQVRASLAARFQVSEWEAGWMIEQLLCGRQGVAAGGRFGNGFTWVVDTNAMREVSLVLGADEVLDSLSTASKTLDSAQGDEGGAAHMQPKRPILSSACPGWICYAEKTHPHVLPHLSRLKSPQALTGTLLKTVLHTRLGIPADQIWHVAIMPCFDKKLEASRQELTDISWRHPSVPDLTPPVRDVDCVITARELLMLADTRGINFPALPRRPLPLSQIPFPDPILSSFLFHNGAHQLRSRTQSAAAGTSGGYLHHILATQQARHPGSTLTTTRGRNADVLEYAITRAGDSSPVFQAARYYGFRNIQNLVRKLKPARRSRLPASAGGRGQTRLGGNAGPGLEYAYVEVMACPGGCTNGGGQIKAEEAIATGTGTGLSAKEWSHKVDEAYFSMEEDEEEDANDDTAYSSSNKPKNQDSHYGDAEEKEEEITIINGIRPARIHAILAHWAQITGYDLDRLVRTGYRGVESDVGKKKKRGGGGSGGGGAGGDGRGGGETVGSDREDVNVRRVVELAGKVGGGW